MFYNNLISTCTTQLNSTYYIELHVSTHLRFTTIYLCLNRYLIFVLLTAPQDDIRYKSKFQMTHTYLFRFLFFPHQFVTFRDGSTITTHVSIHGRVIQPTVILNTTPYSTQNDPNHDHGSVQHTSQQGRQPSILRANQCYNETEYPRQVIFS